jgi:hypothetical protein
MVQRHVVLVQMCDLFEEPTCLCYVTTVWSDSCQWLQYAMSSACIRRQHQLPPLRIRKLTTWIRRREVRDNSENEVKSENNGRNIHFIRCGKGHHFIKCSSNSPFRQSDKSWIELSLSYGRRSVDQFVLISGSPLGPMTRFYLYPFFSDKCFVVLPVGRPLWREDGSVTYSAITEDQ